MYYEFVHLLPGYWASYNIPFYENIYNMSGYPQMKEHQGNLVSHQLCPRAEIFRRDQGTVTDMEPFKHLLRSNGKFTWNIIIKWDFLFLSVH